MTEPAGPIYYGGFESTEGAWPISYLPDKHNSELQQEGKRPVYYYVPGLVRLARERGEEGSFKFTFIKTEGYLPGERESQLGGVLAFTVRSSYPPEQMAASQNEILEKLRSNDNPLWKYQGANRPDFRHIPIMSNNTTISGVGPAGEGGPRAYYFMEGQGDGSIIPGGENAYTGWLGPLPAAVLAGSLGETAYTTVVVDQNLKLKVWAPKAKLKIQGDWSVIYENFQASVDLGYPWWPWWTQDTITRKFEEINYGGRGLTAEIQVDTSIPGHEELSKKLQEKSDLLSNKFFELATKIIFDPAPPEAKPDEGSSSWLWWNWGAFSLKSQEKIVTLELNYEETYSIQYLQTHRISGQLPGIGGMLAADPGAPQSKYYVVVDVGNVFDEVSRTVSTSVNWRQDPVLSVSAEVGYPDSEGELRWDGTVLNQDSTIPWVFKVPRKNKANVKNPPAGWEAGSVFLKRKIVFREPDDAATSPYYRVQVEQNEVTLDPEPYGSVHNGYEISINADNASALSVGPIELPKASLEDGREVEVSFQALGVLPSGRDRPIERIKWSNDKPSDDQVVQWKVFTLDPNFEGKFRYQVRVFLDTQEWLGPWIEGSGSSWLTISVPEKTDDGVTIIRE